MAYTEVQAIDSDVQIEPSFLGPQVNSYGGYDIDRSGLAAEIVVDLTPSLCLKTTSLLTIDTVFEANVLECVAVIAVARRPDPLIAHGTAGPT